MRRTFSALVFFSCLGMLTACVNDVEPVSVAPPAPWTAGDYSLVVEVSAAEAAAGDVVTITSRLLDPNGADISADYDIARHISPALGILIDGDDQYRFANPGLFTYIASTTVQGATIVGSAEVDVVAGAPANLVLSASPPVVAAGNPVSLFPEITDAYGNPTLGEVTYEVTPIAVIAAGQVTADQAGSYTVTASLVGTETTAQDTFTVEAGAPASLDITLSSYDVERGDGVFVDVMVLDSFGNLSEHPVDLWTDGTGSVAWADYVRFEDEGVFTVFAEIPEYGLSDSDGPVLVDSSGPAIRVTSPDRGAEIDGVVSPTVLVSGSVVDPWTGVSSVLINGAPAILQAGGLFSYNLVPEEGLNELEITAIDGDGNVSDHFQTFLWGDFQPVGQPHDDGLLARMNEGAIQVLQDLISSEVSSGSLTSGLLGNLYTSPQWCVGVGWLAQVCGQVLADLDDVSMSSLEPALDPQNPNAQWANGFLDFYFEVSDFLIDIELTGLFTGNFLFWSWSDSLSANAVLTLDYLSLWTDLNLYVNAANEIKVQLDNTGTELDDVDVDINGLGIFGDLLGVISSFLLDVFEPLLEALLPPIIEAAVPGAVEDALADIEIAMAMDLMGTTLDVEALPGFIECDDDGITISLDSSAAAAPNPNAPSTLGSWYRGSPIPTYGSSPDFGLSLSDKFVNQLMHAVWQAGVIDFSMDAAELGLDISSLGDMVPLSGLTLETVPMLPPVVGPSANGLLELSLGDMMINVYGDPGGVQGLMMQLAVSFWADAALEIDEDGLIQFGVENPVVVFDYVTSDWAELDGEIAEDLMDSIVDLLVPEITGALDEVGGIPIPELPGFTLDAPSVERELAPVDYITVGGGLVLTSP